MRLALPPLPPLPPLPRGRALIAVAAALALAAGALGVVALRAAHPPAADPADRRRGPIVLASGPDLGFSGPLGELVRRWNATHPGEAVTQLELPGPAEQRRAQVVAGEQAGAPCYDVVALDVMWTAQLAAGGYVVPLDRYGFDRGAFLQRPLSSAQYRGRLWAVPFTADAGLLYYRRDLLAQPPRSWDELVRDAGTVAPASGLLGYVSQLGEPEGLTVNVLEAIWSAGGEVLSPDGTRVRVGARTRQGLRRLVDGLRTQRWIARESLGDDRQESRLAFQSGRVLLLRDWSDAYRLLRAPDSPVRDVVGVAPLPTPSALGGRNLAISACSRNRLSALGLVRFLSGPQSQERLLSEGAAPALRSAYQRLDSAGPPSADKGFARLLEQSVERARNRPLTPYYDRVSAAIQRQARQALQGARPVDEAVDALAAELRTALRGG